MELNGMQEQIWQIEQRIEELKEYLKEYKEDNRIIEIRFNSFDRFDLDFKKKRIILESPINQFQFL